MAKWLSGFLAGVVGFIGVTESFAASAAASPSSSPPASRTAWFTVAGNPRNPAVDTVEVDPVALAGDGASRTMNLRVNRSAMRNNWDGVPYRSYESQVAFNCRMRKAQYVAVTYYMAPLWQGEPHNKTDYTSNPRPMLFRDMEPNPTERIVRAACRLSG